MAITLKNEINRRFGNIEENEVIGQASILNSRFKKYGFMNENKFRIAYSILRTRLDNIRLPANHTNNIEHTTNITSNSAPFTSISASPSTSATPSTSIHLHHTSSSLLWKIYKDKVEKFKSSQSLIAAGIIELDRYMPEFLINGKNDPLKWW